MRKGKTGKVSIFNPAMEIMELRESIHRGGTHSRTPATLGAIRQMFQTALDNNNPVLIENSELSSAHSVVIDITYVGDRWCLGYQSILHYGETVKVPYTIQYADIYTAKHNSKRNNVPVKIIFKGENPFGERPE